MTRVSDMLWRRPFRTVGNKWYMVLTMIKVTKPMRDRWMCASLACPMNWCEKSRRVIPSPTASPPSSAKRAMPYNQGRKESAPCCVCPITSRSSDRDASMTSKPAVPMTRGCPSQKPASRPIVAPLMAA